MVPALASGCETIQPQPTCFGLKVGDQIAVTVVDTYMNPEHISYEAGNPEVCGFGFDVSRGSVLHATVAMVFPGVDITCGAAIADFEPFGGWTWTLEPGLSTGGASAISGDPRFLFGNYEATHGTCSGQTNLGFDVSAGANPFTPSVAGQTPNVVMTRGFGASKPGTAACPAECGGDFVVNLQKL
jgi:hypothetical protein